MGRYFEPADDHNPTGYYSDRFLKNLHLKMRKGITPELRKEYDDLIAARPDVWGMKCHGMYPILNDLVPDLIRPTHIIRTSRDREESAASLAKKRGCNHCIEDAKEYLSGNDRNIKAFLDGAGKGLPVLDVPFTDLQDSARVVAKIAGFIGLPVNEAAVQSVRPDLYRMKKGELPKLTAPVKVQPVYKVRSTTKPRQAGGCGCGK